MFKDLEAFYWKINFTFSFRETNELMQMGSISACFVKVTCSSKHEIENILKFLIYLLKTLLNRQKNTVWTAFFKLSSDIVGFCCSEDC